MSATGEAVVADHAIGNEVSGPRRYVEHLHLTLQRLDLGDSQLRVRLDCNALDRAFPSDRRVDVLEETHLLAHPAQEPNVPDAVGTGALDRDAEAQVL